MADEWEDRDLAELKALLEQNRRSILALRGMIEEMEGLLITLSQPDIIEEKRIQGGKAPQSD